MSKRIMIVDDSRVVEVQLRQLLKDTPYEVVAYYRTGEDAIARYGDVLPDLVTMDILMPGMDGLESAQAILKRYPDAKIVMLSSLAYGDTIKEAKDIGAKAFVYKPFQREQVLSTFAEVLGE